MVIVVLNAPAVWVDWESVRFYRERIWGIFLFFVEIKRCESWEQVKAIQWINRGETERRLGLQLSSGNCVYLWVCMLSDVSSPEHVGTGKQTYWQGSSCESWLSCVSLCTPCFYSFPCLSFCLSVSLYVCVCVRVWAVGGVFSPHLTSGPSPYLSQIISSPCSIKTVALYSLIAGLSLQIKWFSLCPSSAPPPSSSSPVSFFWFDLYLLLGPTQTATWRLICLFMSLFPAENSSNCVSSEMNKNSEINFNLSS